MKLPRRVRIIEVGMRDGLQNEATILPTAEKLRCIRALVAAGVRELEVGAFVRPDRVPAMADTAALVRALQVPSPFGERARVRGRGPAAPDLPRYLALVPNAKGLERALAVGTRAIAVFVAASETFSHRNINMTIAESLAQAATVIRAAKRHRIPVRGYISTCWECPYEGRIAPSRVLPIASALFAFGCYEVSLGDTIGAAAPAEVEALLKRLLREIPARRLAVHFHDTHGTALANIVTALQLGITAVDASVGGLGGCPFAPGAAGNVATERVLYMLHRMGIETGIDATAVQAVSAALREQLQPARRMKLP
ncbi:MAG: hydroxymethylglutaryl-CoA lyase [Deltaproteobacteria bacterium]|nr:hydroxymethylglutaryl-CoA lyase [Deltaproteobacteria bacterium]